MLKKSNSATTTAKITMMTVASQAGLPQKGRVHPASDRVIDSEKQVQHWQAGARSSIPVLHSNTRARLPRHTPVAGAVAGCSCRLSVMVA
jgi:hypothetical protein